MPLPGEGHQYHDNLIDLNGFNTVPEFSRHLKARALSRHYVWIVSDAQKLKYHTGNSLEVCCQHQLTPFQKLP